MLPKSRKNIQNKGDINSVRSKIYEIFEIQIMLFSSSQRLGFPQLFKIKSKTNYGCSLEATLLAADYTSVRPGDL